MVRLGGERLVDDTSAPFLAQPMNAPVCQKMFQRAQQIGTKPSALRVRSVERLPLQHARKELVRQFTRGVVVAPLAPEKGHHRPVVSGAQIAQRLSRWRRVAARGEHLRPARRGECVARRVCGTNGFPVAQFKSKTGVRAARSRIIYSLSGTRASKARLNAL